MKTTIKTLALIMMAATTASNSNAQVLRSVMDDAKNTVGGITGKKGNGSLSQSDVAAGLKEALQVGAKNATQKVSAVDGFYGNALIKILMPPEAQRVEKTLRQMGLGSQVDNAILSMNRAAEDASGKALQIFVNAITSMSIQDAISILRGPDDAATQYLKSKTTAELTKAFRPVIEESLDKVNATKYWSEVFTTYNNLPTTFKKVNPDLPAYVTEKALNGIFVYVADEEARIRKNPAARVTDLLKKVFGQQ